MHTAREYYYPSESYLLDLTLVAVSTLGAALREQLAGAGPVGSARSNLLLSAEVLQQMAAKEPATLELLRQAMQQGTAGIVGGEFRELELPLLGPEAIRAQLEKGLAIYHEHLAATRHLCAAPLRHDAGPAANSRSFGVPRCAACDARRRPLSGRQP